MRKAWLLVLVLVAWAVGTSVASASLTSYLLEKTNDSNDVLADNSFGFIVDANGDRGTTGAVPNAGDVAFGIARIDTINSDGASLNKVYIVYSFEFDTPVTTVGDPYAGGWTYRATDAVGGSSAYTLSALLGGMSVGAGSVAAVLEWQGAGAAPFANTSAYNFGNGFLSSPASLLTDLGTLAGSSGLAFAVGLLDTTSSTPDSFKTKAVSTDTLGRLNMQFDGVMSITDTGFLNPAKFAPLIGVPGYQSVTDGGVQYLQSVTYDANGFIATRDAGDYLIHYTPEPASATALAGLGLAGLAWMVRRRKSRA